MVVKGEKWGGVNGAGQKLIEGEMVKDKGRLDQVEGIYLSEEGKQSIFQIFQPQKIQNQTNLKKFMSSPQNT